MFKTYFTIILLLANIEYLFAQNSFPASGNVLIGTTLNDFQNKLQVNGGLLLGSPSANGDISLSSKAITSLGTRMLDFSNTSIGVVRGGDLMLNNFWGVAVNINKGLLGDHVSADYSVVPNTSSFTVNSYTSSQTLNTLFVVRYNGNVGIGTMNPQSKLSVNGAITAKKVKVTQTGWPDYVLDSTYNLPRLSSIETYIKANHHLPDISSTAEINKNGLDIGKMQKKQMQKIEELTLYLIRQNKIIKNQQREIEKLKERMRLLEK